MPRPRSTTPRPRRKKEPPVPGLETMVDTLADDTNPDDVKAAPRPSRQKPGPRKVLSETSKMVGDGLAMGVLFATQQPDTRKNLTKEEAESIGHPIARMIWRRAPTWLKPLLPKTNLSPEDAADIEEIIATLAKWSLRLLAIVVQDAVEARENAKISRQQQAVANHTQAQPRPSVNAIHVPVNDMPMNVAVGTAISNMPQPQQPGPVVAQPVQNGHNPAFNVLPNIDMGFAEI